MLFDDKTQNNIMIDLKKAADPDTYIEEGSLIDHAFRGAAAEFEQVYIELGLIDQNGYAETADRDHLVLRAKERGIEPFSASNAVWKAEFNIDVDLNTRFSAGELTYICTEEIEPRKYQLMCEQAGTRGNIKQQDLMPIKYIDGFDNGKLVELLIPARDKEDTESFRKRYFDSFHETAFGGNRADYLAKTNKISGVGGTKVTRIWNSNLSPASMIPQESVDVWYSQIRGTLDSRVKSWLDTVYHAAKDKKLTTGGTVLLTIINSEDFGAASDTLVQTVQTIIDPEANAGEGYGLAPIGHMVKVESAGTREIHVKTTLVFETGYGWGNLQGALEEAVSGYLLELRKEWAGSSSIIVRIRQIENRILNISGIVDMQDTLINDSAANLTLGRYEIPVFGGIGV